MIKVLIVDDSSFIRKVIRKLLSSDKGIEVIDEAADGREALDKIHQLKPDVVCLDIIMPLPDGLWTLEKINKQCPTPVVIFSSISAKGSEIVSDAFRLGVVDVIQKPSTPEDIQQVKKELIEKIKIAALVDRNKLLDLRKRITAIEPKKFPSYKVIAIGCSAGGPPALNELLRLLPGKLPAGILVAQHMPEDFIGAFGIHLQGITQFIVKVAENGDMVTFGRLLISPADTTLTVHRLKQGGVVRLDNTGGRPNPSVDAMFESVANTYGRNAIGIILSGMGSDGVNGLRAIKQCGGKTLVQDEKSSLIWGMPKAAIEAGVADEVLPIHSMAQKIVNTLKSKIPSADMKDKTF